MKAIVDSFDRQIVPRWRDSAHTVCSPDLLPLRARKGVKEWESDIEGKAATLAEQQSIGVAADLANTAILEGRQDLLAIAAKTLLAPGAGSPKYLADQIRKQLEHPIGEQKEVGPGHDTPRREEMAQLRRQLLVEPRNPVVLMDLARLQATSGNRTKAERLAWQALTLSPNNRWLLRSTSKLLTAHGKPDEAHRLLIRSGATMTDPWLIAAELATAQASDRSPKYWRQAQSFLEAKAFAPIHLSELASAVGTIDVLDGKIKKAKERFHQSLKAPTENALAQMKWAEGKIRNGFHLEELISNNRLAYEAAFRTAYTERDMEKALQMAQEWMADEQFAPEPVANVTYVASLLDDYDMAIRSTERELRLAAAREICIINNRVYALMSGGKAFTDEKAGAELSDWVSSISRDLREGRIQDVGDQVHALANLGLLFYRAGELELGRKFYDQAADLTKTAKTRQTEGPVLTYHAREAILSKAPWASEIMERAKKSITAGALPGPGLPQLPICRWPPKNDVHDQALAAPLFTSRCFV
ncbi:MAG: hypothetical protein C0607_16045, partial [Azoarcus sp.]